MGIFIIFVLSRALHPMVIDYSKVDGKMLYYKNSPAIMSLLVEAWLGRLPKDGEGWFRMGNYHE